jgi:hypothetical protein
MSSTGTGREHRPLKEFHSKRQLKKSKKQGLRMINNIVIKQR